MMGHKPFEIVLTCEHASRELPQRYQALFKEYADVLLTHEGWDIGAFDCFTKLKNSLSCRGFYAKQSRLLIDLNRSLHNPKVFSRFTKPLSKHEKELIVKHYYQPYRDKIYDYFAKKIKEGKRIYHFSIHSFTPVMNGVTRNADFGLLYDPKRVNEKQLARQLYHLLKQQNSKWRIRMNYPYHGTSDGLTTTLRQYFKPDDYLGLEIEINQALHINATTKEQVNAELAKAMKQLSL